MDDWLHPSVLCGINRVSLANRCEQKWVALGQRLFKKYNEVSKPNDWMIKSWYRFEVWKAIRQWHC